ncbi:hypothetical protein AAHK20_17925 [Trinickia sp. YCB016]
MLDDLPEGRAIRCFLSPIDARIEAIWQLKPGRRFYVMRASNIDCRWFHEGSGRWRVAHLHLAWSAYRGRLLTRLNGMPRMWGRIQITSASDEPHRFEVDEGTLLELDKLHESAGLFAWRETLEALSTWDEDRCTRAAENAVSSLWMETGMQDVTSRHLAMFNPESERWHFVERSIMESS